MAKYEVIDLTLSDSDSDGDFIQVKKAKVEPNSPLPRYRYAYFTGHVHVCSTVVSLSQADSFALGEAGSFASQY